MHAYVAISFIAACPTKGGGELSAGDLTTTDGSTSGSTSGSTGGDPTGGDPTGGDPTGGDPTGGDPTGDPTTGGTTDTEGSLPAECDEADPAVSAAVEVVVEHLPDPTSMAYDFDVLCDVDGVAAEAGIVTTELTCDFDGSSQPATVRMPEAPEGEVAWDAGKSVRLIVYIGGDDDFGGVESHLELREVADDALLAAALRTGSYGADPSQVFAPLTTTAEYACGSEGEMFPVSSLRIDLRIPDGAMTSVFSRHRGQLPIDAMHAYAIDVEEATGNHCCHFSEYIDLLVRRVVTG